MTKTKVSATLTPERLAKAREVTGISNLSEMLDQALEALIERKLEERWLEASDDTDLPGAVEVDLSSIPWDDQ